MVFQSDRQRKAVMAKLNQGRTRSSITPAMARQASRLNPRMKRFLASKIRKNIREGKPARQAIAIAFSQARKKFGNSRLIPKTNPHLALDNRTRRLLFLIFGTAIALSLIRQIRTSS